jgi:hypothetical protein
MRTVPIVGMIIKTGNGTVHRNFRRPQAGCWLLVVDVGWSCASSMCEGSMPGVKAEAQEYKAHTSTANEHGVFPPWADSRGQMPMISGLELIVSCAAGDA